MRTMGSTSIAQRKIKQYIHGLYIVLMFYILFSLVIVSENVDYPCKREFIWPMWAILIIAGILTAGMVLLLYFKRNLKIHIPRIGREQAPKIVLFGCVLFALVQIYISFNYYFLTDWDVDLIYQSAREIVNGTFSTSERYGEFCWYYSTYPNNMELLGVFVACLKVNQYFGVLDPQNGVMVFIVLNSIIVAIAGYLLYDILTNNTSWRWGMLGWTIFIAYIGTSPWVVIPYSDSLGLLFPIAELWIYTQLKKKTKKWPFLILLGFVGGIGYRLKPQVAIILIAIIILFILEILCNSQDRMSKSLSLGVLLLAFLLAGFLPKTIEVGLNIPIDENRQFGTTHFVMMGMNPSTEGIYSQEDCDYSHSFGDTTSRRQGEIEVIKERLSEYGINGYLNLLNKKMLTTYGDGSFAWGLEGSFWKEIIPLKNSGISKVTRDIYYNSGPLYTTFLTYMQIFWVGILCLQVFANKGGHDDTISTVELSIIGLTIFELLFESRARYLYTYAPLYILMAVYGLQNLRNKVAIRKY